MTGGQRAEVRAEVNVLVVFYSRYGATEALALASGIGALQAHANIRLRRVADLADRQTIESDPAWKQNLDRMNMDYVTPRPADPAWADVIVLATPTDRSAELNVYVDSLPSIGSMAGKIAALIASNDRTPDDRTLGGGESAERESALEALRRAAARAGLTVVPAEAGDADLVADARALGRRASDMARALKAATV